MSGYPQQGYPQQQPPYPQPAYGHHQQQPPPQFQQPPPFQPHPTYQSQPSYVEQKGAQPTAHPGMSFNTRNAKNVPAQPNGDRAWSFGLCDCFGDFGTCCLAYFCPCIVYSQNKSRLDSLERRGTAHPEGGDSCTGDCFLHGCAVWWGCGWAMQMGVRSNIRNRYRIDGGGCGDCCTAFWCTPCELTQESREIELEEGALRGNH